MILSLFRRKEMQVKETEEKFLESKEKDYYKIIDECAKGQNDFTIQNSSNEHASYVLKLLLENAEKEVCLFIESFDFVFSKKDLANAAISFLQKPKARLKIAHQDPCLKNRRDLLDVNFLVAIFGARIAGKIEIWDARELGDYLKNYFFVNDRYGFRYVMEQNAVANFGDQENGERLNAIFNKIVSKCKKVIG